MKLSYNVLQAVADDAGLHPTTVDRVLRGGDIVAYKAMRIAAALFALGLVPVGVIPEIVHSEGGRYKLSVST